MGQINKMTYKMSAEDTNKKLAELNKIMQNINDQHRKNQSV